jgi:hypothetical protein
MFKKLLVDGGAGFIDSLLAFVKKLQKKLHIFFKRTY